MRTSHALAAARIVAVALLAGVLCPPATQAASTPPPTVTISPLPGTPDATPSTQISFLGVAPSALSQIEVRGSHTGNHSGRLEAYSTGTGASPMVSSRMAAKVRCRFLTRMRIATTVSERPAPTKTAASSACTWYPASTIDSTVVTFHPDGVEQEFRRARQKAARRDLAVPAGPGVRDAGGRLR